MKEPGPARPRKYTPTATYDKSSETVSVWNAKLELIDTFKGNRLGAAILNASRYCRCGRCNACVAGRLILDNAGI